MLHIFYCILFYTYTLSQFNYMHNMNEVGRFFFVLFILTLLEAITAQMNTGKCMQIDEREEELWFLIALNQMKFYKVNKIEYFHIFTVKSEYCAMNPINDHMEMKLSSDLQIEIKQELLLSFCFDLFLMYFSMRFRF